MNSNTSLVSVVIPTFNRGHCISEAIESVLAQSYQNYEIIVVDDGSVDETKDKLQPYADKIRYFYQNNCGVSAARNRGISEANGDWIAFLDSDDIWVADKLDIQIKDLRLNPKAIVHVVDAIITGNRVGEHVSLFELRGVAAEYFKNSLRERPLLDVLRTSFFTQCCLIKRNIFEKSGFFCPSLNVHEDFDLLTRVALEGPFYINCYRGVNIRRLNDTVQPLSSLHQTNRSQSFQNQINIYTKLINDLRLSTQERKHIRQSLGGIWAEMAEEFRKRHEWRNCFSSLLKSIAEDPGMRAIARSLWYGASLKNIYSYREKKKCFRRSEIGSQRDDSYYGSES